MRWFWKFLLALKNGADDFCHHHIYSCRCPHCIFPMSPIPPDHFITGLRSYKAGLLFGIIIITFIHVIVPTVPIMEGVVTAFYVDPIGNVASWSAGEPTKKQCRVTRDQKPMKGDKQTNWVSKHRMSDSVEAVQVLILLSLSELQKKVF